MAKASPGKYTFASSGVGALIHLTGEMFKQAAGVELTHVPYKGTTQILPDLLDGRVDMALDSLPAYIPHLKSGKLRALAVASRSRSALMPELPTMAEAGVPGVVSQTDYALYAPVGTARDIVMLLNRETNAVLQLARPARQARRAGHRSDRRHAGVAAGRARRRSRQVGPRHRRGEDQARMSKRGESGKSGV